MYNYFFDLDGVLIDENNKISPEVLEFIRINKIMPIIATGRLNHDAEAIYKTYNFASKYSIGLNGACIKDDMHNIIYKKSINNKIAKEILETLYKKNNFVRIELNSFENRYFQSKRSDDFPKEFFDSSIICDLHDVIEHIEVAGFLLISDDFTCMEEELQQIELLFKDEIKIEKTSMNSIEIFNSSVSKGDAIEFLKKKNFLNFQKSISYGDSENDIAMLQVTDFSFAIKGKKKVEDSANYVIEKISDSFIIIENL